MRSGYFEVDRLPGILLVDFVELFDCFCPDFDGASFPCSRIVPRRPNWLILCLDLTAHALLIAFWVETAPPLGLIKQPQNTRKAGEDNPNLFIFFII